jgi:hypothetical protein
MISAREHITEAAKTLTDYVWLEMPIFAATGRTEKGWPAGVRRDHHDPGKNMVSRMPIAMVFYSAKRHHFIEYERSG